MSTSSGSTDRSGALSRALDARRDAPRGRSRRVRTGGKWLVGGVLLGSGLISVVWWKEREHLAQGDGKAPAAVHVTVPAGGRALTFPLGDGSRVTLAPGSSLDSRGEFGDGERTLHLTGEALFNVADGRAPFVVHAAGVKVEDVSTAFVVRAIPAAGDMSARALVAVTEGDVRVFTATWQGEVHEGSALLVDSAGAHAALGPAEARGSVAWTSGALLFADEPTATVVERLARWTGLAIQVDSSLHAHRLTLAIEDESPDETVRHLAKSLDARAVRHAGGWSVVPRKPLH